MKAFFLILGVSFLLGGCGVKGDPIPPETSPEIGRGKPTYRRAMRNFDVKNNLPDEPEEDNELQGDEP